MRMMKRMNHQQLTPLARVAASLHRWRHSGDVSERRSSSVAAHAAGLAWLISGALIVTAACGPGGQRSGQQEAQSAAPAGSQKTLRVGITADAEPREGGIPYGSGAGGFEPAFLLHAGLTVYDDQGALQPRLAQRLPTIENGDWSVTPDGKMEVSWKLRPEAKWHDGTPLTGNDVAFGFKVSMDPELAFLTGTGVLNQIAEVAVLDPQTVVVRWKNAYIYANDMGISVFPALPDHLLAPLYGGGDKQAFAANSYFTDQWVGLGPYKVSQWSRGSFIDATANNEYVLGKPKIDRVSLRYIGDTNSLIVSLISGDIDAIAVGSLKAEEANTIKTQWESKGAGNVVLSPNKLRLGKWSFRDPTAPWAGDPRIRQALTKLIDRQSIVDTILAGISEVDDITLPKNDPAYRLAQQRGLPNLSYDASAAHRLMAEAGLTRGPDGAYRTAAGAPFAIDLSATGDIQTNVKEMLAIADAWKGAGLAPTTTIIPTDFSSTQKNEARAKEQGVVLTSSDLNYVSLLAYVTSDISTEATRWRGANSGGYSNSAFDQLYNQLLSTLTASQRDPIAADLVKISLDQMTYLPLEYSDDVSAAANHVRGMTTVPVVQRANAWNIHAWETS
jgi:peptide/nickel transport system substrate-binding protein